MKRLPVAQPRIVGVETEYGVHVPPDTDVADSNWEAVFSNSVSTPHVGEFTISGGRLYVDGDNVEYSTPEIVTVAGLISALYSGREIAKTSFSQAVSTADQYLIERTDDSKGTIRGQHENYLIGTDSYSDGVASRLADHIAARPVVIGPGSVVLEPEGYTYVVDPRGYHLGPRYPHYKSDNESLGGGESQRLEITAGSHNMFPFGMASRVFATSSVVRLIEHDRYPAELHFDNPKLVRSVVAADPTTSTVFRLRNGKQVTALQFEYDLLGAALTLDLPKDEAAVVTKTCDIVSDMIDGQNPRPGYVEWFDKQQMLQKSAERRGTTFPNVDSAVLDIKWHTLTADNIVDKLRLRGLVAYEPTVAAIEQAMTIPPDPTRALARSTAIKDALLAQPAGFCVGWDSWGTEDRKVIVPDAYDAQ